MPRVMIDPKSGQEQRRRKYEENQDIQVDSKLDYLLRYCTPRRRLLGALKRGNIDPEPLRSGHQGAPAGSTSTLR